MGLFSKPPAERFASGLLEKLPLGILVARLDDRAAPASLRLLYANAAGARIARLGSEQAVGKRLADLVPETASSGLLDRLAEVVRSRTSAALGEGLGLGGDHHAEALPLDDQSVAVVFEEVGDREELQRLRETEASLNRKESRYRSLVEASAAIVWTTPPSGAFADAPPAWMAATGQAEEDARGWGWLAAVHPDDRERTEAAWRAAIADEANYEVEHRLRRPDGGYRQMAVRATPVHDDHGDIVEWIGVHTDVEEQAQAAAKLAASEARLRTLFDGISDVVLVYPVGPDGPEPFLLANEAAVETYGYPHDELLTMTVEDLVAPDRLNVGTALAELRRTRRATFDSVHVTKDGRRVPMSTSARLIEFDDRLCVLALCRDDTERRQFRRELSRANLRLERGVAERTAQLEAFAEDLKILHRITTSDDPADQRPEAYLAAGCEMFDLPVGILSSTPLHPATGERLYRLEAVVSPSPEVEAGLTIPLSDAFCDAVVAAEDTVAYGDAASDPVGATNPACTERGFRAFIGTPVWVDGELFGTLNFISPEPRPEGFDPYERDLIEVMADTVSRVLRSDHAQAERGRAPGWYESVIDTLQEGVVLIDRDARVARANPATRELLGIRAAVGDLLRTPSRQVLDGDGQPLAPEELPERRALRTGRPVEEHVEGIVQPDGTTRWYRVSATPVDASANETPGAVVVSFIEITDLRAVTATAAQTGAVLRSVLAASAQGVMALRAVRGDDGAIVDFVWILASPRAAEIVGRPEAALVGARLLDVFPGHRGAGLFDVYTRVVESGESDKTVISNPYDGFETSFQIVAAAIPGQDALTVSLAEILDDEVVAVDDEEEA